MSDMLGMDIHVKTTDKDGLTSKTYHRVWDRDRFMAARREEARKAGGKASVAQITVEQFKAKG